MFTLSKRFARDGSVRSSPIVRDGLRPTVFLGVGVSHRSGIFGSSRMLGNVNGGGNYIYTYLEWKMK